MALKAHIVSGPQTLTALGPAIGHAPGYLTATLRGEVPLKVRDLFALFEAMGESPRPFFKRLYPLVPSPAGETPDDPVLRLPSGESFTFRDVIERGLANLPVPPAAELTAKAGHILREHMKTAKLEQLESSRLLVGKAHALGQALRGNSRLQVFHVFGILHLLNLPPARFFAELFWPEHPGLSTSDTVAAVDQLLSVLRQGKG